VELVFLEGNVNQNTYIKYKGMLINPIFLKNEGFISIPLYFI